MRITLPTPGSKRCCRRSLKDGPTAWGGPYVRRGSQPASASPVCRPRNSWRRGLNKVWPRDITKLLGPAKRMPYPQLAGSVLTFDVPLVDAERSEQPKPPPGQIYEGTIDFYK